MEIVLVPGLWLDGSSWARVAHRLEEAGHTPRPLTLPGMESADADRSGITLVDHVDEVVAAIDAAEEPVLLVGHSVGCAIAACAVDARPERVTRAVYVGGWPAPEGRAVAGGFTTHSDDLPMPELADFDDADLKGLDDGTAEALRAAAIPSPARLATDTVVYTDDRRHTVPVTLVCPEYSPTDVQEWLAAGAIPVAEVAQLTDVGYVDLDTGHWPQLTAPGRLADIILDEVK